RNRKIGTGIFQRARGHGFCRLRAHRAVAFERHRRHAEHRPLGVVRISDETAVDDVRGTRDLGQRRGDQAAGAGFGGGDMQAAGAAKIENTVCRFAYVCADHVALHSNRTVAVAMATMPSPRPVKPSFSLVVALMATRLTETPAIAAMRSRMASR